MRQFFLGLVIALLLMLWTGTVSAHVVVKPSEVGMGKFQTFTIGVPNEKDIPTIGLRLTIPEGLESVSPNVKPGWTIEIKKKGEGEEAKVTEIIWTGGSIPEGQRDEFAFSAKVPSKEATLQWKAYQTYGDGTVVSWDQKPTEEEKDDDDESSTAGPYSETKIIDDLKTEQEKAEETSATQSNTGIMYASLLMSAIALALSLKNRK